MADPIYGLKRSTSPASGVVQNWVRACVFGPIPENGWAHTWHGQVGRTGSVTPQVRGQFWTAPGGGAPAALVANTNELAASTLMTSGGSVAELTGDLTQIKPVSAGARYGIGFATRGADLMHGMVAAASLPASANKTFYNRASVGSTGPYDPFGHTSSSNEGHLSIGIEYTPNRKPNVPIFRAPHGLLTSAPSAFTGWFRDQDETIDGRDNTEEVLKQYRIQLREKGQTALLWDETYDASTAEQTARAFEKAYAGTGSLNPGVPYEWRCGVSDWHGEWSEWSTWLEFQIGSQGSAGINGDGGVSGRITTLTPGSFLVTYNHPHALGMTGGQLQILNGDVPIRDHVFSQVAASGESSEINPPWSTTWTPLDWSQALSWRWLANDSDGIPTAWSPRVAFNTNFRPSTPAQLSSSGGAVIDGFPMLQFAMVDLDDTVATGLTAEVRIKTGAGALIATRTAQKLTETTWGHQTTGADLADTGSFRWDARGRDLDLDGNWSAEAHFSYVKAPVVLTPSPGSLIPSSSLSIVYEMTGQVLRRFVLYEAGTSEVVFATAWETTAGTSADIDLSGLIDNGAMVELVIEVEIAGAVITRSTRVFFTILLDPEHVVVVDVSESGAVVVGNEPDTSAIRIVRESISGVTAENFIAWKVKEGAADWVNRWNAIDVPLPEPGLLLPLDGDLSGTDANGAVLANSAGALRFVEHGALIEEGTTNYVPNPILHNNADSWLVLAFGGDIITGTRVSTQADMSPWVWEATVDAVSGNGYLYQYFQSVLSLGMTGSARPFTPSVLVKVSRAQTAYIYIRSYYSDSTTADTAVAQVNLTPEPQTIVFPAMTSNPAKTLTSIEATLWLLNGQVGDKSWMVEGQIEELAYATSPVNGDKGAGYAHTGPAHASASTRAETYLSTSNTYLLPAKGTIAMRVILSSRTGPIRILWYIGQVGAGFERIYMIHNPASGTIELTYNSNGTTSGFVSATGFPVGTPITVYADWDENQYRIRRPDGELNVGTRLVAPQPAWGDAFYIGSVWGVPQTQGTRGLGNVVTFDRVLGNEEHARTISLIEAGPLNWDNFGASDRGRWLGEAVPLAAELGTVAESRAFDTTELTYFEPRLGNRPQSYALTATIKDGINELESLPVNPLVASCEATATILSDVANPTGLRAYLAYLRDYKGADHKSQALAGTWSDDPNDELAIIESAARHQTIAQKFEFLPVDDQTPLQSYLKVWDMRGERDDETPVVVTFRDHLGDRLTGRITKLGDSRSNGGRIEADVEITGRRWRKAGKDLRS